VPGSDASEHSAIVAPLQSRDCLRDSLLATDDARLLRLFRYVEAHFDEPLSSSRAADICGLEKTYFSRFFRAQVGMKFLVWSRRIRVERAKALLANRRPKITTIALAVGYKSITTFERNFRRGTGLSPAEFREALRCAIGTKPQETPTTSQETPRP
jgi:AraC family transcriptional regulator